MTVDIFSTFKNTLINNNEYESGLFKDAEEIFRFTKRIRSY